MAIFSGLISKKWRIKNKGTPKMIWNAFVLKNCCGG
jgi:hypothetical protein